MKKDTSEIKYYSKYGGGRRYGSVEPKDDQKDDFKIKNIKEIPKTNKASSVINYKCPSKNEPHYDIINPINKKNNEKEEIKTINSNFSQKGKSDSTTKKKVTFE